MRKRVRLTTIPPPVIEVPSEPPTIPTSTYESRLQRLRERMVAENVDSLLVYADREHAANFSYLTGFDPRFEEALLVVNPTGVPKAILGAENLSMVDFATVELQGVFFPTFGLLGQPRAGSRPLVELLAESGISGGMTVGMIGWKYFTQEDGSPLDSIEVPHYIVEAARSLTENPIQNVTSIMMAPGTGLRTVLEADQIAAFEHSASLVAAAVMKVMDRATVGVSEIELARPLQGQGRPLSVHPMLSVGDKARFGLTSPSKRVAETGDFLTMAFGIEGALTNRAAFLAHGRNDLAPEVADWLEAVAMPFYSFAATWLESVGIGTTGKEIWDLANELLPPREWGWVLNPGHFIATDEWVSTPFTAGSEVALQSGNYIQLDLIIDPKRPYYGANLEDGIVLADETLRNKLRIEYPQVYHRFMRRREYIINILGIQLGDDVLPMSDLLAYYRPYLLSKDEAFIVDK